MCGRHAAILLASVVALHGCVTLDSKPGHQSRGESAKVYQPSEHHLAFTDEHGGWFVIDFDVAGDITGSDVAHSETSHAWLISPSQNPDPWPIATRDLPRLLASAANLYGTVSVTRSADAVERIQYDLKTTSVPQREFKGAVTRTKRSFARFTWVPI